ncbi:hypothetical protein ACFYNO_11620 [Kitasatospora sp. NPDC006697]
MPAGPRRRRLGGTVDFTLAELTGRPAPRLPEGAGLRTSLPVGYAR